MERLRVLQRRLGLGLREARGALCGENVGTLSLPWNMTGLRMRGDARVGDLLSSEWPRLRGSFRGETSPSPFKGTLDTV
jgi:hypothetical protein